MIPAPLRSRLAAFLLLASVTATVSPAAAFFCYIPSTVPAPVALREKPDPKAKVLAMMPGASMVKLVSAYSYHKEWVKVTWYPSDAARKGKLRGWTILKEIYGGECVD